jgi:cysteinyl-tRNA synthetase
MSERKIQIYNSETHSKHVFKSLVPGKINLYVCGMTVYDYCHLGHGRVLVMFDVITRYLRECGYDVTYVRNITDIDDKIINRAHENNEPYLQLTERFIHAMHEDEKTLGVLPPTHEPRATEYIPQMIEMIQTLIEKGHAYVASSGDVCYEVRTFSDYGKLTHQDFDNLQTGARVAVVESKRDPMDFVLWKMAKPDEPSWDAPWGKGRPGWHIECSVMSTHCLGNHFDIHGGGFDLMFPHHENEIAQSEGATGTKFVEYWMHVGFIRVDQEKMSKSLGNFFTIREVLSQFSAEVVRYFLVSSHYRSPLDYSLESLKGAQQALERLYTCLRTYFSEIPKQPANAVNNEYVDRFFKKMDDDFNTPEALAVLFDLARDINKLRESDHNKAQHLASTLLYLSGLLGILQSDPEVFLKAGSTVDAEVINSLINDRNRARENKQWAEADRIRQELISQGVILEDGATGTTWRKI